MRHFNFTEVDDNWKKVTRKQAMEVVLLLVTAGVLCEEGGASLQETSSK